MDIEIGRGKTARRAYGLDEIAIVPSRRTRDPEDIDISWSLGNLNLDLPCLASALDAAVDPINNPQIDFDASKPWVNSSGSSARRFV